MKKFLTCLLLTMALVTNACALEVPTDTTIQNLNGSQQLIKTYTMPPGADPQTLIEEPLQYAVHQTIAEHISSIRAAFLEHLLNPPLLVFTGASAATSGL